MVTDERYRQLKQEFPGKFTDEVCKMGAEAIKTLLERSTSMTWPKSCDTR